MSFWFSKRDSKGREAIWQIDVDLISVVVAIGILAAFVFPRF